jgi:AbrB family looped-hinge helix DNA binding protein
MVGSQRRAAQTARVHVVVGPKGRVVIPAELRDVLHLGPGDRLVAYVEEGRLVLERTETVLESIRHRWATASPGGQRSHDHSSSMKSISDVQETRLPGAARALAEGGPNAVDELIQDRRAQAAREEGEAR